MRIAYPHPISNAFASGNIGKPAFFFFCLLASIQFSLRSTAQLVSTDYDFRAFSRTYNSIVGGDDLSALEANEGVSVINLPFDFTYNSVTYNTVWVSSNGWLSFNNPAGSAYATNSLNSSPLRNVLAPLWDDLSGTTPWFGTYPDASWQITDGFPNRVLTVEWKSWRWNYGSGTDVISFQIKLYETSNIIEFCYRQGSTGVRTGSASIGISGALGDYLSLSNSGANPTPQSTVETTSINMKPANNQVYEFKINKSVVNFTAVHPPAGLIYLGSQNNVIGCIRMDVNFKNAVTPSTISFTSAGTYIPVVDILQYKLYENSQPDLTGAALLQTINATGTNPENLVFSSGFSTVAASTTKYYLITADVDNSATINRTIGFKSVSLSDVTLTDPSVLKTGSVAATPFQTIAGASALISAVHPPSGVIYQNSNNNIIAGYQIEAGPVAPITPFQFSFTTSGSYAGNTDISVFSLYENTSLTNTGAVLIGSIATSGPAPQMLTYTFSGANQITAGQIKYYFITANVPVLGIDGHTVSITATPLSDFVFSGQVINSGVNPVPASNTKTIEGPRIELTAIHPAASNIATGSTNNIIAVYEVEASKVPGFVTPVSVKLSTTGTYSGTSDIAIYSVYQNTANTLSGATFVKSVTAPPSGGIITFTGPFDAISNLQTQYLIVTCNVNPTAVIGKTTGIATSPLSDFVFSASGGLAVAVGTVNPAAASKFHTIVAPTVTVSTLHPVAGNMLKGSQDNMLAIYKMEVVNNYILPDQIILKTAGTATASDIQHFDLYQNNSPSLSGAKLVGTLNGVNGGGTLTYTGNFDTISYKPPYNISYLMLVCDITGGATVNNKVNIAAINPIALGFHFKSSGIVSINGTSLSASNPQNIVNKLDVYWSNLGAGIKNWDISTNNWAQVTNGPYNNSVWLTNGYGFFEGTAGRVNIVSSAGAVVADSLTFKIPNYLLVASTTSNGFTLVSPASITVNSGVANFGYYSSFFDYNQNPIIQGVNGLVKRGPGELMLSTNFRTGFQGNVIVNQGELTFGNKNSTAFDPDQILQGNGVEVVNATLTIAGYSSNYIPMKRMNYMKFRGNSILKLHQTGGSINWMRFWPTTGSGAPSGPTSVPTQLAGELKLMPAGNTSGILGSFFGILIPDMQNMLVTGSTSLTDHLTLYGYASSNASLPTLAGTHLNFDLGGYGHYLTGVTSATTNGTLDDNGYSITFYGMGNSGNYASELCFNATNSNLTGNLIIGDESGTNGGWVVTNTTTSLTRGNIYVNKYSKLTLQLTSNENNNITYSPKTIYLSGRGPGDQNYYPSALDLFNFSNSVTTTSFSSDIVLSKVTGFDFASIGVSVAGINPSPTSFQINGKISGTAGLEKIGPGNLMLNAQNVSGNYNTYEGGTTMKAGTLTVNRGSNLAEGFVKLAQVKDGYYSYDTKLVFNNEFQRVTGIQTEWTTTNSIEQIISLNGNGNGATLLVDQNMNTVFGNPASGSSQGYIEGWKGNLIKDGTGILELTGKNTYTGLTQVKGGILKLNNSAAQTLLPTNSVHIIGGKLDVQQNQILNDVTLSTGELNIASGKKLTIMGKFTLVPNSSKITGGGTIAYGNNGELIYAGNAVQFTSAREIPVSAGPATVRFNNFSTEGVVLTTDIAVSTQASVNGWTNLNGKKITGAGQFTLFGLKSVTNIKGNTTAGSPIITNINTTGIEIGMRVTGSGIPDSATVIYIDPLANRTITINQNANASATNVVFSFAYRGGLMVNLPAGIDEHLAVSGNKTYNSGANYKFLVPTAGKQIYPAFPSVGVLNFSPANDIYIMAGKQNRVVMGASQSVTIDNDLHLRTGIFVTNTGLITFNNTGTLTAPGDVAEGGEGNGTVYTDSYIATCDQAGNPITNGASATTPYLGTEGFKIKNVGATPVYFPVGSSFLTAGTGITIPSPNRMMIQNMATPADFSVIVQHGDIGYTHGGEGALRVNRIWYVKSSKPGLSANMKLYFTKRNWTSNNWPVRENEVEYGFNYGQTALLEKDYSGAGGGGFIRLSSGSDIRNWIGKTDDVSELYGVYSIGVSQDAGGNANGINEFYRFSIVNPGGIILPVNIIAKANKENENVRVDWKCYDELNVDHYVVQRSDNGIDFSSICNLPATERIEPEKEYFFYDLEPLVGKNFYRITASDRDGKETFSNVVYVNMPTTISDISLYPNPATTAGSYLNFSSMPKENYQLTLRDLNGIAVSEQKIGHPGGSAAYQLQLPPGLASGIYHISIRYGNEQKIIRFLFTR